MELNENNRPLTEVPANEMPETSVQPVADASQARYPQRKSKEEVIERLKEIIADNCNADKQEIDLLKQTFYKLHKAEQDAAQKDFVNNGGKAEAFIPKPDSLEGEFKSLMGSIKEKRNELMAAQEEEKEKNLARKLEILEKIKNIAESPEEAGKTYNEFKQLQQEWNDIKLVPATKVNELRKNYQLYTEKFYDMLKLNYELREYDFKKNLEQKKSWPTIRMPFQHSISCRS